MTTTASLSPGDTTLVTLHDGPPAAPPVVDLSGSTRSVRSYSGWWRGPAADPRWARPALLGLLAVTAALYLINLMSSGWANAFYSAAAQAGSVSWKAFFWQCSFA